MINYRKRVLFPFVGDTIGGSHLSTLTLINELLRCDYTVIILLYQKGAFADFLEKNGYEYRVDSSLYMYPKGSLLKNIIKFFRANLSSYLFLRKNKIDIVHTNDIKMHLSWCFAAFFGYKHIWHQRNVSGRTMYCSFLSSEIVTITSFCKNSFPRMIRNKAVVVKNPVSIGSYAYKFEPVIASDVIKIVWIANLVRNKRLQDALYVVEKLKSDGYQVILNVLGDLREPIFSEAKLKIEELGIEKNVTFVGFTEDVVSWIKSSSCLLATAENEGFGRALVEAMLVGTPVIASNDGGHLEIITNRVSGLLVPLGDIDSFCSAILRLRKDVDLYAAITENARRLAVEEFSPEIHRDKIARLYSYK